MNPERRRKGLVRVKRITDIRRIGDEKFDEELFIRNHLKNRKVCSCNMCCNGRTGKRGRKNQKFLTLKEETAVLSYAEELAEARSH